MSTRFTRPVLLLFLVGCATGRPDQASDGPPAGGIEVWLRVEQVLPSGERRALAPGGTLRSGDRLALDLRVDQPAYVYVQQRFADGTETLLFPGPGEPDLQLLPAQPVSVPPGGGTFVLDDRTGQEELIVQIAPRPLRAAAQPAPDVTLRGDPPPKPPAPPPPPPPRPDPDPARIRDRLDDKLTLRARSPAGGIAVLRFPFQHQRR